MLVRQSKRSSISVDKPTAISIEFTKIYKVMEKRLTLGYSAYELSVLLGKNDFFVRDVENPLDTKRYNPDDTNYLLLIFNSRMSSIMLPKLEQNIYHLEITSYLNEIRKTVYEIALKSATGNSYTHFKTFEVEPKDIQLTTTIEPISFKEVRSYIDILIKSAYFDEPRRALDVFESCKSYFGEDFHPRNMIKVLNFYTNKKSGISKLNKADRNDFGRRLFRKQIDAST
jgi:hypothetical protein